MNQAQFNRFDAFLVAAIAANRRFGVKGLGNGCALAAFAEHTGTQLKNFMDYPAISRALGLCSTETDCIWSANDDSHGDPRAVREVFHRLNPHLAAMSGAGVGVEQALFTLAAQAQP